MAQGVTIDLLNHASIIVQDGTISLLCDPWFEGTCLRGAWGLRYFNPNALEQTVSCSHLWISHLHSDHFHMPTLRQIAHRSPQISVLANPSLNYDMQGPLQRAGFAKIQPLDERRPVSLSNSCEVTRYPATGIDNMLVIRTGGMTILNLNDCNLPAMALRSLRRKIGPIDILLVSYNHAGKLLEYPSHEQVKEMFKKRLELVIAAIDPAWVIPFASLHYYCSRASAHQNGSLLTVEEVAAAASKILPLAVGDHAVFVPGEEPAVERLVPALPCTSPREKQHGPSIPWQELVAAATAYRTRLRRGFLGVVRWIPPLAIRAEDLDRMLTLDLVNGVSEWMTSDGPIHIEAHSETLFDWLGNPLGAGTFWGGGDFAIAAKDTTPVHRMMLAGLLLEHGLAVRDVIRMLMTPRGWKFFLHRREECFAILMGRRFIAGDSRL